MSLTDTHVSCTLCGRLVPLADVTMHAAERGAWIVVACYDCGPDRARAVIEEITASVRCSPTCAPSPRTRGASRPR